jgi:hypothetical protein
MSYPPDSSALYTKENVMQLSAPKQVTYIIAVAIAVLGILVELGTIPGFASSFALVLIAFIVLALSLLIKGV